VCVCACVCVCAIVFVCACCQPSCIKYCACINYYIYAQCLARPLQGPPCTHTRDVSSMV